MTRTFGGDAFDSGAFDVDLFDDVTSTNVETWTDATKQVEPWTNVNKQSEIWTPA